MTPADVTARIVASHAAIGQVARRRAVPIERAPDLIEAEYATRLVAEVQQWRDAIAPLVAELPTLLERARADSVRETVTQRIGLRIIIENPVGSVRHWVDTDGTPGQTTMRWAYGRIDDLRGADGEDVDVYLGPLDAPDEVHVVHQRRKGDWDTYDEDKVMLGWDSADAAKAAYLEQYDDPRLFGGMSTFTRADFIARLRAAGIETAPATIGKITHADARAVRTDDTSEGRRARGIIEHGRSVVRQTAADVQGIAPRVGRNVANHQAGQLARQLKAGLGVAVPTRDRAVPAKIEHFVAENVAKIRSIGERAMASLERIIGEAFTSRAPVEEVAAEIARQLDIAESYARRLAAEQIAKLTAQVRMARHAELGIDLFQWMTEDDGKVRPHHAVKHKRIFPYKGSRAPSFFPGEERGCRCRAVPILDEIRVKAGIPIGRGRQRIT
jgi:SPP1 gp7 family putative phage head morphogenesis protein